MRTAQELESIQLEEPLIVIENPYKKRKLEFLEDALQDGITIKCSPNRDDPLDVTEKPLKFEWKLCKSRNLVTIKLADYQKREDGP